jgi:hypothetical protein
MYLYSLGNAAAHFFLLESFFNGKWLIVDGINNLENFLLPPQGLAAGAAKNSDSAWLFQIQPFIFLKSNMSGRGKNLST